MPLDLEEEFADTTSLHGIGRISQSAKIIAKLIWTVIFLAAFGLFLWQFSERLSEYLKFNYNTLVEVEHLPELPFPAVTICNYNRFYKSQVSDDYQEHLENLLGLANALDGSYDYSASAESAESSSEPGPSWIDEFDFDKFTFASGFRLDENLLQCEWKGRKKSCFAANFTAILIPEYGLCYQFNVHAAGREELYQTLPGEGNGLRVLINISQDEYTESFKRGHHEAGLRIVVHHWDNPPLPETHGLAIPPGFHTYATVRQSKYIGLPKPWGKCKSTEDGYNQRRCRRGCRQRFIEKECDCNPFGSPDNEALAICTIEEQTTCVEEALQKYRSDKEYTTKTCQCPAPCVQIVYKTSLSMTLFPSNSVAEQYHQVHQGEEVVEESESAANDTDDSFSLNDDVNLRKNLVFLDVYFDELSETKFEQVEAMSWSALLSDLGGQMGLFLGMSVITAAEVVEYLVKRVVRLFRGEDSGNKVMELNP